MVQPAIAIMGVLILFAVVNSAAAFKGHEAQDLTVTVMVVGGKHQDSNYFTEETVSKKTEYIEKRAYTQANGNFSYSAFEYKDFYEPLFIIV